MTSKELFERLYLNGAVSVNIHTSVLDLYADLKSVGMATDYDETMELMFEGGAHLNIKKADIVSIDTIEDDEEDIKVIFQDGTTITFFILRTAAD